MNYWTQVYLLLAFYYKGTKAFGFISKQAPQVPHWKVYCEEDYTSRNYKMYL